MFEAQASEKLRPFACKQFEHPCAQITRGQVENSRQLTADRLLDQDLAEGAGLW